MWLKLQYQIRYYWAKLFPAKEIVQGPLVLTAVFKNEAPFLKEWLDFHYNQGFSRIYLVDNYSTDHPETVLKPYIASGRLVLSTSQSPQMNARIQAMELNRSLRQIRHREGLNCWVAVIDVDEFLFNPASKSIPEVLKQFQGRKIAAVMVNWLMFGTSGIKQLADDKPMTEQLIRRAHLSLGEHQMVKPILYLANVQGFLEGPHQAFAKAKASFVYTDGGAFNHANDRILEQELRLHHYWYRSEDYYNSEKRLKRRAFGDERSGKREADHIRACNYEEDRSILPLLKRKPKR